MRMVLKFTAIAFFIMAAAFVAFSVPFFWQQEQVLLRWPSTQARVVDAEVVTMTTSSGEKLYNTGLEFEFEAHGDRFRGGYVFPHASIHREPKEKLVAQYPIGSMHEVRFNPADPKDIRIHVGYNVDFFVVPVFVLGLAAICAAIGGGFLTLSRVGRSREAVLQTVSQVV